MLRHALAFAPLVLAAVVSNVVTPRQPERPAFCGRVDPAAVVGFLCSTPAERDALVFRDFEFPPDFDPDWPPGGVGGGSTAGTCEPRSCAINCTRGGCSASASHSNSRAVCYCDAGRAVCSIAMCGGGF